MNVPDVHDRRPQRGWIRDGYQAPRPLHQVPEVATLTFAKYSQYFVAFHFANLENFQLRNSRIFPVIDIFSEANNRLTFKQSHKAQAFPIPIHVAASKESCVIVCSQRKIFHKWSFFSNCASSREVLRGLVPNNGQVA